MDLDDDIPDLPALELDSRRPHSGQGKASPSDEPSIPRPPARPSGLSAPDELEPVGESMDIALASVPPPPSSVGRGGVSSSDPAARPAVAKPAPGSGRPPLDPVDVAVFADYGPAPDAWFGTPLYALKVLQRQRALGRDLALCRKRVVAIEDALAERLALAAEALRARIDAAHPAVALFAQLGKYDELTHSRAIALGETSRKYAEQLAEIDERTAAEEEARGKLARLVQDAELDLGRLSAERARAEAKLKHLDIALRGAHDAARIAAGPDAKFAPPEHAQRIASLDAQKAAHSAEVAPTLAAWTAAAELVRQRQSDEREARKKVDALRNERKRIEQTAGRELDVRSEGTREAERDRFSAYAAVARDVLSARPDDFTETERSEIAAAEKRLLDCERDLELHVRAVGAADVSAVRRGMAFLFAAAVAVLLLFGAVLTRSGTADVNVPPPATSAAPATTR